MKQRRSLVQVLIRAMIWMGTKEHYGEDQKLLEKLYWPRVKLDAVIHFQLFFYDEIKINDLSTGYS